MKLPRHTKKLSKALASGVCSEVAFEWWGSWWVSDGAVMTRVREPLVSVPRRGIVAPFRPFKVSRRAAKPSKARLRFGYLAVVVGAAAVQARYLRLVEQIWPGCEWRAGRMHDPIVATVDGWPVASIMPLAQNERARRRITSRRRSGGAALQ